jgi:hypothetical protein|tara:strand:- start:184 stop:876 length:693 start_codon:yes stop_codon:yes gene_type:complete
MQRIAKRIAVSVLGISALYALWMATMVSSTTIKLGDTGYAVAYRMAWGWGMEERVDVFHLDSPTVGQSGDWLDIWKKPNNSGMSLYRSEDGSAYLFGFAPGVYRFDVATGQMDYHCYTAGLVSPKAAGASLAAPITPEGTSTRRRAQAYNSFIEPTRAQEIPDDPPASRYYEGLRFLGMFGVTRGGRDAMRGGTTAFASSEEGDELIDTLDGDCEWSSFVRDPRDSLGAL